jgi:hypothetical protein
MVMESTVVAAASTYRYGITCVKESFVDFFVVWNFIIEKYSVCLNNWLILIYVNSV